MAKIETVTITDVEFVSLTVSRRSGKDVDDNTVHQAVMGIRFLVVDDVGNPIRTVERGKPLKKKTGEVNLPDPWAIAEIGEALTDAYNDLIADTREAIAGIAKT